MGVFDQIFAANSCHFQSLPVPKAIRLLRLHPSKDDGQIECSLQTVLDCQTAPPYYALSYCWGTERSARYIRCDGEDFLVTKDLYSALLRLRTRQAEQLFWIDAVCINQHNVLERNAQVSNMCEIYNNAESIFVWLGEEDEHTATVFHVFRTISLARAAAYLKVASLEEWPQQLLEESNLRAMWQQPPDYEHNCVLPPWPAGIWLHVARLFQRSWFERVWIIQEVSNTCKATVLCGAQEVLWLMVGIVANWLIRYKQASEVRQFLIASLRDTTLPSGITNAHFLAQPERRTLYASPFLWMLNESSQFKATEPKDKIFALIQHTIRRVPENDTISTCIQDKIVRTPHLDIMVDYRLSMDELNKLVTVRSIQLDQSLEALNFAWKTRVPDSRTPSWIADWHEERLGRRPPLWPCLYKAAADTIPSVRFSTSGDLLLIEGVLVDHIESVDTDIDAAHWVFSGSVAHSSANIEYTQGRLGALSALLVQDDYRWIDPLERISPIERQRCMRSFCAFLTQPVSSTHLPGVGRFCDACMAIIAPPLSREPGVVHRCPICRQGNFDLCKTCYEDDRCCPHPEHKPLLKKIQIPVLRFSADAATVDMVRTMAKGESPNFFSLLTGRAFNRRTVFRTKAGDYGLCPITARPGDVVVIMFGGRTPFILRRMEDLNGSQFRLISDCYLDGYMDGEAVRHVDKLQRESQQFVLV